VPIPTDLERSITAFGDVYRRAEAQIAAELAQILDDPNRARRVRRLRALAAEIDRRTSRLEAEARAFLNSSLPSAWSAGAANAAVGEFTWTQGHRQALGLLAQDTYAEVLRPTRFMSRDVKALIRSEASGVLSSKVIAGQTALGAGREIEARLRRMGVSAITYADGRNIRASTYAEMLARTKTAAAYNLGGLNQLRGAGITHVEGIDSGDCGLTSHSDPFKVDGKVFPIEIAGAYPIGHPNCVRDFASRPDITSDEGAAVASTWRSPEAEADQANFVRYLRETGTPARAAGRQPREPRQPRRARATLNA
jgi:hypothetical protein